MKNKEKKDRRTSTERSQSSQKPMSSKETDGNNKELWKTGTVVTKKPATKTLQNWNEQNERGKISRCKKKYN